MKRLITISFVLCVSTVLAMPSKTDLANAQPLVDELMSSVLKSYRAKTKTAKDVAETAVNFVKDAEEESTKFLLLKGAITFFTRAGEYDKAADVIDMLKAEVNDIPPETIAEIIYNATRRTNSNKAPRLFEQYKAVYAQINAQKGLKNLEAELKKRPGNLSLRREYAESLAVFGDWQKALKEFAKLKDSAAEIAKSELEGKAKSAELAEFWWNYKPQVKEADGAIKARAAMHYKKAIDGEEISGLKKTLAEQRIAEVGTAAVTAAVENNLNKGDSAFKIRGNKATLDLGEKYGKLEFVKCPAGKFNMYLSMNTLEQIPVKITRPFWIMKSIVTAKELIACPGCPGAPCTPNRAHTDLFISYLQKNYGDMFPKGYIIRLPSLAEFDYAYHANTHDRNDSYFGTPQKIQNENKDLWKRMFAFDLLGEKKYEGPVNKWGLYNFGGRQRCLDVFPLDLLKDKNVTVGDLYELERPNSDEDPLYWTDDENKLYASYFISWRRWTVYSNKRNDWGSAFRLVIGPDLVKEWKEKNKKK